MNLKAFSNFFILCSIPEIQKSIQEYLSNRKNLFLRMVFFSDKNYFFTVYFFFIIFFYVIRFFNLKIYLAWYLELFLIYLLYFRWKEKNFDTIRGAILSEETSWFDIQIWEKPFFLLKYDKLLSFQKFRSILRRLFLTFCYFFLQFLIIFSFQIIFYFCFFFT